MDVDNTVHILLGRFHWSQEGLRFSNDHKPPTRSVSQHRIKPRNDKRTYAVPPIIRPFMDLSDSFQVNGGIDWVPDVMHRALPPFRLFSYLRAERRAATCDTILYRPFRHYIHSFYLTHPYLGVFPPLMPWCGFLFSLNSGWCFRQRNSLFP